MGMMLTQEESFVDRETWLRLSKRYSSETVSATEDLQRLRHNKAQMWYSVAGVPNRYRSLETLRDARRFLPKPDATISSFLSVWEPWYTKVQAHGLAHAGGFYFWSEHNTGKTTLAVLTMLSACDFVEGLGDPFFLHAATYVSKRRGQTDDSVSRVWEARAYKSAIFVLDDVGSESDSDYAREQMTTLLEARAGSVYPSIFTGNISPEKLGAVLGGRLAVRLLRYNTSVRI